MVVWWSDRMENTLAGASSPTPRNFEDSIMLILDPASGK